MPETFASSLWYSAMAPARVSDVYKHPYSPLRFHRPRVCPGKCPGRSMGLLLPSPAERIVKLNERQPLIESCLRKVELRRQIVVFTREHLKEARTAMLIEYLRETIRILRRRRQ